ncbi:OmpA family protein, partial [Litorivivens sp.]
SGDSNTGNGDGVINDLLGSGSETGSDGGASDGSGSGLGGLVDAVDTTLDPITDPVDAVLAPVVEALEPVTEPVVDGLSPVIAPADGVVGDTTGGSLSDALTTSGDGDTSNGDGVINDLLGSGSSDAGTDGGSSDGSGLGGLVDVIDTTLDPITDPVDNLLEPIVEGLEPATGPLLTVLDPVISPLDGVVGDITGGSLEDALGSDGGGVIADLLGSNISDAPLPGLGGEGFYGSNGRDQMALQRVDEQASAAERCSDGDADTVCDSDDLCPMSKPGSKVLANGCDLLTTAHLELEGVRFDTNSAELTPEGKVILKRALVLLNAQSDGRIIIAGHADTRGSDPYNEKLSLNRARAVANYLAENGISVDRMEVKAYGESDPVAAEDSEAGSERNRRAVLIVAPQAQRNAMTR